jgi:hypothetical protein
MSQQSVLLVSTSYPIDAYDWRGRFIADMVETLAARDELQLSVWAPEGVLPSGVTAVMSEKERHSLSDMIEQGGIAQILRGSKLKGARHVLRLLLNLRQCYRRSSHDIFHINWLQNALPLPADDRRPALITVLGSDYHWLALPGVKQLLRRTLRNRRTWIAPNAEWMVPRLQQVFGDIAQVHAIPFGIASGWYRLQRENSGPASGRWLAVSRITPGKIGDLFSWGKGHFGVSNSLHLLGPHQDEKTTIPSWVHYHGPTNPLELRSTWFPGASGLISLSRHDEGRPQVILEAMAAGLPVIASDMPAHRDIIRHRETGFIVSSSDQLRDALDYLSIPANNVHMGAAAREHAQTHYGTWQDCAARYCAAYDALITA